MKAKNSLFKFLLVIALPSGMTSCTNKSSKAGAVAVTSSQALQDSISAMSEEELSGTLEILGISKAQLIARIAAGSITPQQLEKALEAVQSERALKVKLEFSSNQSTYVPADNKENFLPCLNYDPADAMPGVNYIPDKIAPIFNEVPIVNIVPDEQGIPKEYIFKAKFSDSGCGTRLLKAVCRLDNLSAWARYSNWKNDRDLRIKNGETVPNEDYPVNQNFMISPYFDCYVPNSNDSNNVQQIIYLFLNKAQVEDKIAFSMWAVDGASSSNWSLGKGVEFFVLDKILNRVAPK